MAPERRDVLRASGGLAALLTGGLAGCVENLPGTGPGGPDAPGYADPLYDPAALFEVETRAFVSVDAAAYREQQAALPEAFRESVERVDDQARGVERGDVDRLSGVLGGDRGDVAKYADDRSVYSGVATGSFDAEAVRSQVEAENDELVERGEYEGYTLYGGASEYDRTRTIAAAVSSEAVIGASVDVSYPNETPTPQREGGFVDVPELTGTPSGATTAVDAVKRHVDAMNGNADRLADVDLAATVLDDLGDRPFVGGVLTDGESVRQLYFGDGEGGTSDPEDELLRDVKALTQGLRAVAGSATAGDAGSGEMVVRCYYGSSDAAGSRAETLRGAIGTAKSRAGDVTPPETEVATDGSAVVLTVTGDPKQVADEFGLAGSGSASGGGSASSEVPQAAFSFDYGSSGSLTITHDGGDNIPGDQLRIVAGDGSPDRVWSSGGETVSAGRSVTVQVDAADTVRMVWVAADGNASATLALWNGPEA